jgi:uncharacterized protein YfaT (DUF1175 family)
MALLPDWGRLPVQVMPDDHSKSVPPLPIPNRTVKRYYADDSAATSVKVGYRQASYKKKNPASNSGVFFRLFVLRVVQARCVTNLRWYRGNSCSAWIPACAGVPHKCNDGRWLRWTLLQYQFGHDGPFHPVNYQTLTDEHYTASSW